MELRKNKNMSLFLDNTISMIWELLAGDRGTTYWTKGFKRSSWNYNFENFTVAIMTWIATTTYPCHRWPLISPIGHSRNPILHFSFIIYHWIFNKSNTTDATFVTGTAYCSGASEFTPGFLVGFVLLNI